MADNGKGGIWEAVIAGALTLGVLAGSVWLAWNDPTHKKRKEIREKGKLVNRFESSSGYYNETYEYQGSLYNITSNGDIYKSTSYK